MQKYAKYPILCTFLYIFYDMRGGGGGGGFQTLHLKITKIEGFHIRCQSWTPSDKTFWIHASMLQLSHSLKDSFYEYVVRLIFKALELRCTLVKKDKSIRITNTSIPAMSHLEDLFHCNSSQC